MSSEVIQGDCLDVMKKFPDDYFDSCVCDPPYALGFMGKSWDKFDTASAAQGPKAGATGKAHSHGLAYNDAHVFQEWCERWASEVLRVLKPGAHLLAFGGSRTWHRLACAIEDAGFEIRDSLHWMYGSGFPKSLDISKAIDKHLGADREPGSPGRYASRRPRADVPAVSAYHDGVGSAASALVSESATAAAAAAEGWGTALKPAHEPVVVARKPLAEKTVAANVLAYGTGGLNIDGCRVEGIKDVPASPRRAPQGPAYGDLGKDPGTGSGWDRNTGRWPSNILLTHSGNCKQTGIKQVRSSQPATFHRAAAENEGNTSAAYGKESRPEGHVTPGYGGPDGMETVESWSCDDSCPVAELDRQSGMLTSGTGAVKRTSGKGYRPEILGAESRPGGTEMLCYGDTGGASRFYPCFRYQAKAPSSERPKVARTILRLRPDLSEEDRTYVLRELREAGIDAG